LPQQSQAAAEAGAKAAVAAKAEAARIEAENAKLERARRELEAEKQRLATQQLESQQRMNAEKEALKQRVEAERLDMQRRAQEEANRLLAVQRQAQLDADAAAAANATKQAQLQEQAAKVCFRSIVLFIFIFCACISHVSLHFYKSFTFLQEAARVEALRVERIANENAALDRARRELDAERARLAAEQLELKQRMEAEKQRIEAERQRVEEAERQLAAQRQAQIDADAAAAAIARAEQERLQSQGALALKRYRILRIDDALNVNDKIGIWLNKFLIFCRKCAPGSTACATIARTSGQGIRFDFQSDVLIFDSESYACCMRMLKALQLSNDVCMYIFSERGDSCNRGRPFHWFAECDIEPYHSDARRGTVCRRFGRRSAPNFVYRPPRGRHTLLKGARVRCPLGQGRHQEGAGTRKWQTQC
jgi:hypothetical protein